MPDPQTPLPPTTEYLRACYERDKQFASDANLRATQVSVDIGKEKTQYFEKIALAAGGTIALVVSFVGAHAGKLNPPWLLRSALVALVLTMIAAMYRNWKYPFYLIANYGRQYLAAQLERERSKRDLVVRIPSISPATGQLNDVQALCAQFALDEKALNDQIDKCKRQEHSAFEQTKWLERAALTFIVVSMCMLIALAWRNF
jgi:hypothetical protein